MKPLITLLLLALMVISVYAQGNVAITDSKTKEEIIATYRSLINAQKDFQIAVLKARVKYKVDEEWPLDLDTMTFVPPEKVK
jgi:hypothetical protein